MQTLHMGIKNTKIVAKLTKFTEFERVWSILSVNVTAS